MNVNDILFEYVDRQEPEHLPAVPGRYSIDVEERHMSPYMASLIFWDIYAADRMDVIECDLAEHRTIHIKQMPLTSERSDTHRHDYVELAYVCRGELKQNIDGTNVTFREGDICLIDQGSSHYDFLDSHDCSVIFLGLSNSYFQDDWFFNNNDMRIVRFLKSTIREKKHQYKFIHFSPIGGKCVHMEETFAHIFREMAFQEPGAEKIVLGYAERLFSYLVSEYSFSISKAEAQTYSRLLWEDIDQIFHEQYAKLDEQTLSLQFHYTRTHINRLVHQHSGHSFSGYLRKIRLEKARELLLHTEESVEEIANHVGYNNRTFFYRIFREEYHCTPAELRDTVLKHERSVLGAALQGKGHEIPHL